MDFERTTALTDFVLAFFSLIWGLKLGGLAFRKKQAALEFWWFGFLCLALSAFAGGLFHSTGADNLSRNEIWMISYLALAGFELFILYGLAMAVFSRFKRLWVLLLLTVGYLSYVIILVLYKNFNHVKISCVVTLFLILLFETYDSVSRRYISGFWIIAGVLITTAAMYLQRSPIEVWYFDHNGIFHLVQLSGMYMFYRGGRLLEDKIP